MCDCITKMDKALKEYQTELSVAISFGPPKAFCFLPIQTKVIEVDGKKPRGVKAMGVSPNFCAICGEALPKPSEADEEDECPDDGEPDFTEPEPDGFENF